MHARAFLLCSVLLITDLLSAQATLPGDCGSAVFVCSDTVFQGADMSEGLVADINVGNMGCLNGLEGMGAWIRFAVATSGTLGLTLSADPLPNDLDMALWGPSAAQECPPVGMPLRCTYAAVTGPIGLQAGAMDTSEGAGGNGWLALLTVTAGETYLMHVDNYSMNQASVSLTWQFGGGASLSCAQPLATGSGDLQLMDDAEVVLMGDGILVRVPGASFTALVLDGLGRSVGHVQGSEQLLVPVNALASGAYTVVISTVRQSLARRVMLQ